MILTKHEIRKLVEDGELRIENCIDFNMQLQEHGFDITIDKVYMLTNELEVDFDNSKRRLPEKVELIPKDGKWILREGEYLIEITEVIGLPKDICAIVLPRSTLLRGGCSLESALWDAGYYGKGKLLLRVGKNGLILHKHARVGQMIFMRLQSKVDGYSGTYQNESIVKGE